MPSLQTRALVTRAIAFCAAVSVGCGSSFQGGINSNLATLLTPLGSAGRCGRIGPILVAALVSFSGGVAILVVSNAAHLCWQQRQGRSHGARCPRRPWELCGGVLGSSVMALQLIALPLTGLAVTSVMRSAGSVGCSFALDQINCVGTGRQTLSRRRVVGALVLLCGCTLSGPIPSHPIPSNPIQSNPIQSIPVPSRPTDPIPSHSDPGQSHIIQSNRIPATPHSCPAQYFIPLLPRPTPASPPLLIPVWHEIRLSRAAALASALPLLAGAGLPVQGAVNRQFGDSLGHTYH